MMILRLLMMLMKRWHHFMKLMIIFCYVTIAKQLIYGAIKPEYCYRKFKLKKFLDKISIDEIKS